MKTCLRYGLLGLLAGTLLSQAQEAASPAPKRPAKTPPTVRAGAVVVGEIGGPVKLKELEGIPTELERPASSHLRADRVIPPEAMLQYQLDHSRYGGMVGEALLLDRPWNLFNPLAPAWLGDGTRNLRRDPFTGAGEGVIIFSFRLPDHSPAKSVAHQTKKKAAKAAKTKTTPTAAPAPAPQPSSAPKH